MNKIKMMYVGSFIPKRSSAQLCYALERSGFEVFKVAIDTEIKQALLPHNINLKEISRSEWEDYFRMKKRFHLASLLAYYKPDCVFICQRVIYFETVNFPVPVYQYFHEVLMPQIPWGRFDGVFYQFPKGDKQLMWPHGPEIRQTHFQTYVPFGLDVSDYPFKDNFKERPIFLGFKGLTSVYNGDNNDMIMQMIYNRRQEFIQHLVDNHDCYLEYFSENAHAPQCLIDFLHRTKIAINIPAAFDDWGFLGDRTLIAMACGCVLLQYYFPGDEELGLIDKENCLLFSTIDELDQQMAWIKAHERRLPAIARKGRLLIEKQFNWDERVQIIKEKILTDLKQQHVLDINTHFTIGYHGLSLIMIEKLIALGHQLIPLEQSFITMDCILLGDENNVVYDLVTIDLPVYTITTHHPIQFMNVGSKWIGEFTSLPTHESKARFIDTIQNIHTKLVETVKYEQDRLQYVKQLHVKMKDEKHEK